LLHSALDQQMLGAAFRIGKTEFDSLYGNLTNRFFGPVEFDAIIEKRWDSRGRKPNDPVGNFPVPPAAKPLKQLNCRNPPLGTNFLSEDIRKAPRSNGLSLIFLDIAS
jgi:hypothetical protein